VVSERLVSLQHQFPSDFGMRPRSLDDVDRWKAVEYRRLLLYTGHVVLKDVLPEEFYDHFMCLSVAICILVSSKLSAKYHAYAHQLLVFFVEKSKTLYADEFLVYNVHSLIHLSYEAVVHGSLENCSAWKFQSFMQVLKKLVRSGKNPLAQVVKRMVERNFCPFPPASNSSMKYSAESVSSASPNNAYTTTHGHFCEIYVKNLSV